MIKVDIKTIWDDEMGNIDTLKSGDFNIQMTSKFNEWNTLDKLDYFSDLENWLQTQINNIHEKSDPKESFIHSYIMGTPKSTEQQEADSDPVQYAKRQEAVRELMKTINLGGKRFDNIIRFPKKIDKNKKDK
tara:strand:+ start:246 stop:641 length:396 start_codon:yes stop_codon:yes gene_type:complete